MVKIRQIGTDDAGIPVFEATELETNESISVKNFFEKSKNKYHIVLGPNSANRKYIAHNEFNTKATPDEDGVLTYIVEDKTTGPRVMGTAQPDKWAIPYMTEEEKADYDAIIARAMERRAAEKAEKAAAAPVKKRATKSAQLEEATRKYEELLALCKANGIAIPEDVEDTDNSTEEVSA